MAAERTKFIFQMGQSEEFNSMQEAKDAAQKYYDPKPGVELIVSKIVARCTREYVWRNVDGDE